MKQAICLTLIFVLLAPIFLFAEERGLLIDDFEGVISGGPDGTVDFGAGNGSSVEVTASTEIKHSGKQSLKVVYDAVAGGYMWVARGKDLDAKNADWLVKPQDINWNRYSAISFYMCGSKSNAQIAFDVKDNGNEMWRFIVTDDFKEWKQIVCSFDKFFSRTDWQPADSDRNGMLDFPLKSYQFEPLPVAKGMVYFDCVELIKE